jgi:hypothetical protein
MPLLVTLSNEMMATTKNFWFISFSSELWNFLRIIFHQGFTKRPKTITGKILYTIWLLLVSVMITSFSANIVSHYNSPVKYKAINSIEDMMSSGDIEEFYVTNNVINRTSLVRNFFSSLFLSFLKLINKNILLS